MEMDRPPACYFASVQDGKQEIYLEWPYVYANTQGRIQDFLKGGSESGVDIEGGANPSIVSLNSPPEAMGYLILDSTKIPKNARL